MRISGPANSPLTRESLYELVWSEPMLKVAEYFAVSSSYMARVCTHLNVPRPERGYWAKLAVGKAPKKPPLPDVPPGFNSVITLSGQVIKVKKPLPRPPSTTRKRRVKPLLERPMQHPLLAGAKEQFEAGRLSYEGEYLKPFKRILVDFAVSKTGLDKALEFANNLFLSLEDYGHRVTLEAPGGCFRRFEVDEHEVPKKRQGYFHNNLWSPSRCTVVRIGTVAIGLTIIEMSEEVEVVHVGGKCIRKEDYIPPKRGEVYSWSSTKVFPTGRLRLQAYSPYSTADWVTNWGESSKRNLTDQVRAIVRELERSAVEIARLVEEGERKAELQRQQWEIEKARMNKVEAERRAIKAHQESREEILQIIDAWTKANHMELFFQDAEQRAANLGPEERTRLIDRLKLARNLTGSKDALELFLTWKSPNER